MASAGNYKLGGVVKVAALFRMSRKVGEGYRRRFDSGLVSEPAPAEAALNMIVSGLRISAGI